MPLSQLHGLLSICGILQLVEYRPDLCFRVHMAFSLCVLLSPNFSLLLRHQSYWIRAMLTTIFILITSARTLFPNKLTF